MYMTTSGAEPPTEGRVRWTGMTPRSVSISSLCEGTRPPRCAGGARAGGPPEHDRVGEAAAVLGQMSPDRTGGAGRIKAVEHRSSGSQHATFRIAPGATRRG